MHRILLGQLGQFNKIKRNFDENNGFFSELDWIKYTLTPVCNFYNPIKFSLLPDEEDDLPTLGDVREAVVKSPEASGEDGIPAELLKIGSDIMEDLLCSFYFDYKTGLTHNIKHIKFYKHWSTRQKQRIPQCQ